MTTRHQLAALAQLPRHVTLEDGTVIELRAMKRWDRFAVLAFLHVVRIRDLITLSFDPANEAAADRWITELESGRAVNLLAYKDGHIVAYAGLRRGDAPWTEGLAEFSLITLRDGSADELAGLLCSEAVALATALGLRKLVARVLPDGESVRTALTELGFKPEALLADHVIDDRDRTYDLLIMSCVIGGRASAPATQPAVLDAVDGDDDEEAASPPAELPEPDTTPIPAFMMEPAEVPVGSAIPAPIAEVPVSATPIAIPVRDLEATPIPALVSSPSLVSAPTSLAASPASPTPATDGPVSDASPAEKPRALTIVTAAPERLQRATVAARPAAIGLPRARPAAAPPALPRQSRRPRRRFATAGALAVGALLALASIYLATTTGSSHELDVLGAATTPQLSSRALVASSFAASSRGTGGVFIPVAAPATSVRVAVEGDVTGAWFWCIESSFRIPLESHYCADAETSRTEAQQLVAETEFRISPRWPADALYFVQMYCEHACAWTVQTTPAQ